MVLGNYQGVFLLYSFYLSSLPLIVCVFLHNMVSSYDIKSVVLFVEIWFQSFVSFSFVISFVAGYVFFC